MTARRLDPSCVVLATASGGTSTRRGVTLIESLVSAALLATVIVATLPLLRAASSDVNAARPRNASGLDPELARCVLVVVADEILRDPGSFGIGVDLGMLAREGAELGQVQIPEATRRRLGELDIALLATSPNVRLGFIGPAGEASRHAWLRIEVHGVALLRWIPLPDDSTPADAEPRSNQPRQRRRPRRRPRGRLTRRHRIGCAASGAGRHAAAGSHRSFTLVELLLALVVAASVIAIATAWTMTATRLARDGDGRHSARRAIDAVLEQIEREVTIVDHDDRSDERERVRQVDTVRRVDAVREIDRLQSGLGLAEPGVRDAPLDHAPAQDRLREGQSRTGPERAKLVEGALVLRTRDAPWIGFDRTIGTRQRTYRLVSGGRLEVEERSEGTAPAVRDVLGSVTKFDVLISDDGRTLMVVIEVQAGTLGTRTEPVKVARRRSFQL
ncbi:MAG TPA: hypothetical protein PKC43_10215 [Phycisphaerales bacterium]|nr:hypothetical protein [Phycisphaerales bacterium]HMP37810.1 hypothetical protein [Phycisphaerales bacterium]